MILLAALVLLPQDRVEHLIDLLESPDIGEREQAEKELIAIGEPALPALRKATKNGSFEARERATAAYHAVLWNSLTPPWNLSVEVSTALQVPRAQAWTEAEDSPLYALLEAFQGPLRTAPTASRELPWLAGECPEGLSARSRDGGWRYWRAKADGRMFWATARVFDASPRFLLVSGPFDLSQARGDERIPEFEKLGIRADWETLRLEKREEIRSDGKLAGILFTFGWDQEKLRPHVRHVFLTDRFAILCAAYR